MRKARHSEQFLEELLANSEHLITQYRKDERPKGEIEQGKMLAATYGYLYALGQMGMLEFKDDQVTPVRIRQEYKQTGHYEASREARSTAAFVAKYLNRMRKEKNAPTIYEGMVDGMNTLLEAPRNTPPERDLAAQLGVVAFRMGLTAEDTDLAKNGARAIEMAPNMLTRKRLMDELGDNMRHIFEKTLKSLGGGHSLH